MKNILKTMYILAITTMFMACGGGGSSSDGGGGTNGTQTSATTAMSIGQPVGINGGDKIVNASPDAVVDIVVVGNSKTATLTAGTASIEKI